MQEDSLWNLGILVDVCKGRCVEVRRAIVDVEYYDEQTWQKLDRRGEGIF